MARGIPMEIKMVSTPAEDAAFLAALKAWVAEQTPVIVPPPPPPPPTQQKFTVIQPVSNDQFIGAVNITGPNPRVSSGDLNGYFKLYPSLNLRTAPTGPLPVPGIYVLIIATDTASVSVGVTVPVPVILPPDPPQPTTGDGSDHAAPGAAQLPNLLSGLSKRTYAKRPPWKVAGVDYAVGPRITVFKAPTAVLGTGITVDSGGKNIRLGDNATLSGVDLGSSGFVATVTGSNVLIQDCKFGVAPSGKHLISFDGPGTVTVQYNYFNNHGQPDDTSILNWTRNSSVTLLYNHFHGWFQHVIEGVFPPGGTSAIHYVGKYNLYHNGGEGAPRGAHNNWLQWGGIPKGSTCTCQYNTAACLINGNNEGFQFYANSNSGPDPSLSADCGWNTIVAPDTNAGPSGFTALNFFVNAGLASSSTAFAVAIHDNYADMSGQKSGGFDGKTLLHTVSSGVKFSSNNIDMNTGLAFGK